MEKFKIDPKTIEEIIGTTELQDYSVDTENAWSDYRGNITLIHMMRLDKTGRINNPDGFYYFNDPDELIFPKATEESKQELRKQIVKHMIPASQKVD